MRDWNRNGRIDGADRYIFHEIIRREDKPENCAGYHAGAGKNYAETKKSKSEKKEDVSGWEAFFKGVFVVLVVLGLFVG